jgi:hypothetical protein
METTERNPPKEWFDICVAAGHDPKELRKLDLMDLYMLAGQVIQENAKKECKKSFCSALVSSV